MFTWYFICMASLSQRLWNTAEKCAHICMYVYACTHVQLNALVQHRWLLTLYLPMNVKFKVSKSFTLYFPLTFANIHRNHLTSFKQKILYSQEVREARPIPHTSLSSCFWLWEKLSGQCWNFINFIIFHYI